MDINFGKPFCCHVTMSIGWFRVFGRGFSYANRNVHPPLFSEREGIRRPLRIGRWVFHWLKKDSW